MRKITKMVRLIIKNRSARIFAISFAIVFIMISGALVLILTHKSDTEVEAITSPGASDITGSDFTYITPIPKDDNNSDTVTKAPDPVIDDEVTSFVPADKMDLDPTSITVYVNKEHALPKDYKPEDLVTPNIHFDIQTYDERTLMRSEAAKAIEQLFAAAEKDGCYLSGVSGYRSYARQFKIFTNNIATQGKIHTLQYSAVPGTSEHQTGLTMDVSTKSLHYKLSDDFADTREGKWLADNSYKYGFIIRYPKDKAKITGYAYEPWHIRYVGRGLAYYLHNNKMTLDEYYHYTPDPNFDFEKTYADIINYVAPTATVTATPTPSVITPSITPSITPTNAPSKDGGGKGSGTGGGKHPTVTPVPTPSLAPTPTQMPEPDNTGSDTDHSGNTPDNPDSTAGTMDIIFD